MRAHLLHHARAMHLDGLDADAEHVGDLLVELADDDQLEHLALALGELLEPARGVGLLQAAVAGLALEAQALLDHAQHLALAEGLLDEVHRALLERGHRHRHVAVAGDEHHRQAAATPPELLEDLQPAHARHAHVEQHAAGHPRLAGGEEGLARLVRRHRVAVGLQHPGERVAQGFVVIDDMNDLVRRCGHYAQLRTPSAG